MTENEVHDDVSRWKNQIFARNRNNSTDLTDEQKEKIAQLRAELTEKVDRLCKEYEKKLVNAILECVAKFIKSIEEYKVKVLEMIEKIGENYQKCLDTREENIKQYRSKLVVKAFAEKKHLEEDLVKVCDDHVLRRI